MKCVSRATLCCILMTVTSVHPQPLTPSRVTSRVVSPPTLEPTEAIVFPGDNVTFTCTLHANVSFHWDVGSDASYDILEGSYVLESSQDVVVTYSRINIHSTTRKMSGEIACSVTEGGARAVGFLIVNGVRNGGACRSSGDCLTESAACWEGICECPRNHVHLRIKDKGLDVCREMIYSLYDPCEYDEQCTHLVDPKSVCKSMCVCAPWARDRRGKCVATSEVSYNRSQEMYRVGLIAVTCIIILIVAVSLWITLKRSCREQNSDGSNALPVNRVSVDVMSDKPPSYDDIQVTGDIVETPPNIRDALKHSMTAKRLLRQVSAPAGQLTTIMKR